MVSYNIIMIPIHTYTHTHGHADTHSHACNIHTHTHTHTRLLQEKTVLEEMERETGAFTKAERKRWLIVLRASKQSDRTRGSPVLTQPRVPVVAHTHTHTTRTHPRPLCLTRTPHYTYFRRQKLT